MYGVGVSGVIVMHVFTIFFSFVVVGNMEIAE